VERICQPERGDKAVMLTDGRIRWHTQSAGRLLIYEPSPPVSYAYLLDLGTPVVVVHNTTRWRAAQRSTSLTTNT